MMAENDIGTASVEAIEAAKKGDTVWLFDSQRALHNEAGKYLGRGVWKLCLVEDETRASLVVNGSKFDRKDGQERARSGYSSTRFLSGEKVKQDKSWMAENRRNLIQHIETLDADELRTIAALIGWPS
jgi:hypothetical protein